VGHGKDCSKETDILLVGSDAAPGLGEAFTDEFHRGKPDCALSHGRSRRLPLKLSRLTACGPKNALWGFCPQKPFLRL